MPTLPLERKTQEALALAVLAISAVAALRFPAESRVLFIGEMLALSIVFIANVVKKFGWLASFVSSISVPILFAIIARISGSPSAFEMTALTTFGAAALALSISGRRLRAISMIASGFLTLFAVAISDNSQAVWFAIVWMTICVWHLVANHWERLELCSVENVRRATSIRPVSVVAAVAIFVIAGLAARDRFGASNRLTVGFMPTSGGSQWSDPAARSGVGTGDAAIAAKDHAESFGAVDSELFLESTESTLFDMFSDSIGEPKKKNKSERRQGMAADQVLEAHTKTAKSEKGGSSFSADRMPAKKHLHMDDAVENAVIQWAGPMGIRLAMNRYDTFDGVDWTNEAKYRNERLTRREITGAAWFCDPAVRSLTTGTTDVNLMKVLRLGSTRLPVPMLTAALHIKDVDRQDFFAIDDDGSFYMPGREKVPPLTVVNVASKNVMEDELWTGLPACVEPSSPVGNHKLKAYVNQWTADAHHPYEKLRAIVSHLREEFTFDRSAENTSSSPIDEFLRTRRGGDHLFATTAALMARELGLQSRLVTGFYVRQSAMDMAAGHTNVLPEDVHVWTEVRLDDNRWFEIEPTPGYKEPVYTPSTWLIAKRFAAANWPHALALLTAACLIFATRLFWIDLGLSVLYPIGAILWPRGRMSLAMRVLQTRARYAGCPRVAGRPQRDWLMAITAMNESLHETAGRFCDAADRAAFAGDGNRFQEHTVSRELMMKLKIRVLRQLTTEASA